MFRLPWQDYKPGISLCMMAHSVEVPPFNDGLVEMIEHALPNVDEIRLVDTSPDREVTELVKEKKYQNLHIKRTKHLGDQFRFGTNREISIKDAKYSWILILDPDERITNWKIIRDISQTANNIVYALDGTYYHYEDDGTVRQERECGMMARLFLNGKGYTYNNYNGILDNLEHPDIEFIERQKLQCGYEHHCVNHTSRGHKVLRELIRPP